MGLSDAALDGAALAATLWGDRDGSRVKPGLAEEAYAAITRRLAEWNERGTRECVPDAVARLRPPLDLSRELPTRAKGLLASEAPRTLADRWRSDVPLPRKGFRPSPELRAVLRRLAAQSTSDERKWPA